MANTPRNQWPYPDWNADWQQWQSVFMDMVLAQDATVFSDMEGMNHVFQSLPNASISYVGGEYYLVMASDLVIVSRTYNTRISIVNDDNLLLSPNSMICARVTPGAVGAQDTSFELVDFADIDPGLRVFGYIDDSYNINWWNGSVLMPSEDARRIFSFLGEGGGTDDKRVKVSVGDTTAAFLSEKLIAGSNITLTLVDEGANEKISIASTGGGDPVLAQYAVGYGDSSNFLTGDAPNFYWTSTRQLHIGAGTSDHVGSTNDSVYVTGRIEVDGIADFDSDAYIRGNEYLFDDKAIYFGNSNDAVLGYSITSQTTDTLLLGLPATSNNLIITTAARFGTNWSKALRANPTLFITADSASTSMYVSACHDQSNALIESGYGSLGIKESYISGSTYGAAYMPWAISSAEWTAITAIGGTGVSLLGLFSAINSNRFQYIQRDGGTQWDDYGILYQGTGITLTDGVHGVSIANSGVLTVGKDSSVSGVITFAGDGVTQGGTGNKTFTFANTITTAVVGAGTPASGALIFDGAVAQDGSTFTFGDGTASLATTAIGYGKASLLYGDASKLSFNETTNEITTTAGVNNPGTLVETALTNRLQVYLKSGGINYFVKQTHYWNGSDFVSTAGYGFGTNVLQYCTGSQCNGFGDYAMVYNTGNSCNGLGYSALRYNKGNSSNGIGYSSLYQNIGLYATSIGHYALRYNTGIGNAAFGYSAWSTFLQNTSGNKTFDYTAIDPATDYITIPSHGFGSVGTYTNVLFTQGTSPITGLANAAIVQIYIVDANTVSTSRTHNITAAGTGTGHTFTPQTLYSGTTVIGYNGVPSASNQIMLGGPANVRVDSIGSTRVYNNATPASYLETYHDNADARLRSVVGSFRFYDEYMLADGWSTAGLRLADSGDWAALETAYVGEKTLARMLIDAGYLPETAIAYGDANNRQYGDADRFKFHTVATIDRMTMGGVYIDATGKIVSSTTLRLGDSYISGSLWEDSAIRLSLSSAEWTGIWNLLGGTPGSIFGAILASGYLPETAIGFGGADNLLYGDASKIKYHDVLSIGTLTIGMSSLDAGGKLASTSDLRLGDGNISGSMWEDSAIALSNGPDEWTAISALIGTTSGSLFEAILASASTSGSLDAAYRVSLPGSKTITADNGAVSIVSGANNGLLSLTHLDATRTSDILNIHNDSTAGANGIYFEGNAGLGDDTFGHRLRSPGSVCLSSGYSTDLIYSGVGTYRSGDPEITPGKEQIARLWAQNVDDLLDTSATLYAFVEAYVFDDTGSGSGVRIGASGVVDIRSYTNVMIASSTGYVSINTSSYVDFNECPIRNILNASFGETAGALTWDAASEAVDFEAGTPGQTATATTNVTTVTLTRPTGSGAGLTITVLASGASRSIGNASGCFKDSTTTSTFIKWIGGDGNPDTAPIVIPSGKTGVISIRYNNIFGTPTAIGSFNLEL